MGFPGIFIIVAAIGMTALWVYYDEKQARKAAEKTRTPDGDDD